MLITFLAKVQQIIEMENFITYQLINGPGAYATYQIMLGQGGGMVPWNSFAVIGQILIFAGFSLRAMRLYIVAKNSENPSGVLQAILNLIYAVVIVVVISKVDWTKLLN